MIFISLCHKVVDNLDTIGKQMNEWCQENQLPRQTGKSEVFIISKNRGCDYSVFKVNIITQDYNGP